MDIAIIGYGRMGHEIESAAISKGHSIRLIIDQENITDLNKESTSGIDVAIEFTAPDMALGNIVKCLQMKVPVVSGTTGWLKDYGKAVEACLENDCSFIHSSNFSIGVNILFRLNSQLAGYLSQYREYKPFIEEIHHTKKLDAPSGTAISLAGGISYSHTGYNGWCSEGRETDDKIPVRSVREGAVPGIHLVEWESEIDKISLRHESKSRKGLAIGAIIAAEFISGRKGVFSMADVLGF